MLSDIYIFGHPSGLGGADTELAHQILVWQAMNVTVHLFSSRTDHVDGCVYHTNFADLRDKHVIAYCNKEFLKKADTLAELCRSVTWVNCMTYSFEDERNAVENGLIDLHLFQTEHQRQSVCKTFKKDVRWCYVTPYYDPLPFVARSPDRCVIGRVSRVDKGKWSDWQTKAWDLAVIPQGKSVRVLGWDPSVCALPSYAEGLPARAETIEQFYPSIDVFSFSSKTFENLPRVGMEAMASGAVVVADERGGWEVEVEDSVTGFLAIHCEEHAEYLTFLAKNPYRRQEMATDARKRLEQRWGIDAAVSSWKAIFKEIENDSL